MQHDFERSWLQVTVDGLHDEIIRKFNKGHSIRHETFSPSGAVEPLTQASPARSDRQVTADEDELVTYGLGPNDTSEYLFGRIAKNRAFHYKRKSNDPDFILDCGSDIHDSNRPSKLSVKQFRVYYNGYAWMFHDTSRRGCVVNGQDLSGREDGVRQISLRPDMWNSVDLSCTNVLRIWVRIGHEKPLAPYHECIDLARLDIQSQTPTSSSISNFLNVPTNTFQYYHLASSQRFMSKLDGRCYTGYEYEDIGVAQNNYLKLKMIFNLASQYGILPIVDGVLYRNNFLAITQQPKGRPLECETLQPESLAFVFVQILEKLAFLHHQGLKHGNISASTIMVDDGRPVETELAGIDLSTKLIGASEDEQFQDLVALRQVATDAFAKVNFHWEKSPVGPFLLACGKSSRKQTARRLLDDMGTVEPGSTSWPFHSCILVRRTFQLTWHQHGNPLVRLKELHQIINCFGTPRDPFATKIVLDYQHDRFGGPYISAKVARKLLNLHRIFKYLPSPLKMAEGAFAMEPFKISRIVNQHVPSRMSNISQILDMAPDFTAMDELPIPNHIQEVRGHPDTAGFYVSDLASFMVVLQAHIDIDFEADTTENSLSSFETEDFENCVLVPTDWPTPPFLRLGRDERQISAQHIFSTVQDCRTWFQMRGLHRQSENLANLEQPFPREWRTIPILHSLEDTPCSTASSDLKFQWKGRQRSPSSGDESEASTLIAPSPTIPASWHDSESGPSQPVMAKHFARYRTGGQSTRKRRRKKADEIPNMGRSLSSRARRIAQYATICM